MARSMYSNVVGFDDAPFSHDFSGRVPVVGAVFASRRFEGLILGDVTKDGTDAAEKLAGLINDSRFAGHIQLVLLQGITMAGFNVVDVFQLHESTRKPVIVVARRKPDLNAVRDALLQKIPGGEAKWRIIERLGPVESLSSIFVQRVGISSGDASSILQKLTIHGNIPEPLRTAHIIAGALALGESRGRV